MTASNPLDSPGEVRERGREVFARLLGSRFGEMLPLITADEWQDIAIDLLNDLDDEGLLVVHEAFLLALKNGVRNG